MERIVMRMVYVHIPTKEEREERDRRLIQEATDILALANKREKLKTDEEPEEKFNVTPFLPRF